MLFNVNIPLSSDETIVFWFSDDELPNDPSASPTSRTTLRLS